MDCRTPAMGGHVLGCPVCGHEDYVYNSCGNRHCPKCGVLAKERWLSARTGELLPVHYFHLVITLPDIFNKMALSNPQGVFSIFFKATGDTLMSAGRERTNLGAELGFMAILHTWGQKLNFHPHIHCVVPGGGISEDGMEWVACARRFFISVRRLSLLFKGKFLALLKKEVFKEKIKVENFQNLLDEAYEKAWVVYAKKPFGGPEQVLEYLGRYTHKVAISNHRILADDGEKVSFTYRDYQDGNKQKVLTLSGEEFLRRFFLHRLPLGFTRIRYFGFMANAVRKKKLALCQQLLSFKMVKGPFMSWREMLRSLTGLDRDLCPACKKGRLVILYTLPPVRAPP